jgi:DNA-binding transcriptional LysR family regulator
MLPAHRDIVYFLEVAQTQNLSRASERLGISQPSLSMSIKRLEDSLGFPVLLRAKSGVTLTKSGQLFSIKAKELIETWNNIKASVNQLNQEVSGHYKLGCHASVAQYTMPKILPALLQKYPRLEFQLFHDLSRNVCEKIISFEIDFGIVVNPTPHPDLVIKELSKDTVHFWVAEKGVKNNSKTLIIDPHMLQAQDLLKRTKNKSFSFDRVVTTANLELIAQLTEAGGGIGIIPKKVVEMRSSKLKIFDESLPHYTDSICMVYRADMPKTFATKEIVSAMNAWPN